jgi:phage terminase small subunit
MAKRTVKKNSARRRLTPKQRIFVAEYLKDLNATQAAIRAGYSEKTADRIGPELLVKTCVSEAVRNAVRKREKETGITSAKVLEQYARLAFSDIRKAFNADGNLKPLHELGDA